MGDAPEKVSLGGAWASVFMSVLIRMLCAIDLTRAWDELSRLHVLTASNGQAEDLGLVGLDERHGPLEMVVRWHFG